MLALLGFLAMRSRRTVVLAAAASGLFGASAVAAIAVFQHALQGPGGISTGLAVAFGLTEIILLVAGTASASLLVRLSQRSVQELRLQLCQEIMDSAARSLERIGPVRLQAALTDDVMMVSNAAQVVPTIFVNFAVLAGAFIYIGFLSPVALAFMIGAIAAGAAMCRLPSRRGAAHLRRSQQYRAELHQHMNAVTYGFKELKLSSWRRESVVTHGLVAAGDAMVRESVRGAALFGGAAAAAQALFLATIGAMIAVGPHLGLGTSSLTGLVIAVLYMYGPMTTLLSVFPVMNQSRAALAAIRSLRLGDERVAPAPRPAEALHAYGIRLDSVIYQYDDSASGAFMLGPVTAHFDPGTISFIVGGNGSGKTTLGKIMCGIYSPHRGAVHLNAKMITHEDIRLLREVVTAAFSDAYLFPSLPGAGDHAAVRDLRASDLLGHLGLAGKVGVTNGRFTSLAVSTGQRRRLVLVSALLEDRPVMLFDEWAADQDPEFREWFYLELLPALKARGKTVIVITHDDRYFGTADQILKLDRGEVAYSGVPLLA